MRFKIYLSQSTGKQHLGFDKLKNFMLVSLLAIITLLPAFKAVAQGTGTTINVRNNCLNRTSSVVFTYSSSSGTPTRYTFVYNAFIIAWSTANNRWELKDTAGNGTVLNYTSYASSPFPPNSGTAPWSDALSSGTGVSGCPLMSMDGTGTQSTLPVSLLYFLGKESQSGEGNSINLTWATSSELNAKTFKVERSRDLQTFVPITTISAAGNSTDRKDYSFTDNQPFFGTNYYRLSQIDFDGTMNSYRPIAVIIEDKALPFGVFPNPVKGQKFNVKVESADETQLQLTNILGIRIPIEISKVTETILEVRAKNNLSVGTYVVTVQGLTASKSYKIIVSE